MANGTKVETFRDGGPFVELWDNVAGDGSHFYSLSIGRTFKVGEEFKTTHSFSLSADEAHPTSQADKLIALIEQAREYAEKHPLPAAAPAAANG